MVIQKTKYCWDKKYLPIFVTSITIGLLTMGLMIYAVAVNHFGLAMILAFVSMSFFVVASFYKKDVLKETLD